MLSEGAVAPGFELPALVDGEKRRVALSEYLGDDVVILAFYPADFNPACDEASCDLGELDLFTMQKDVTILGISPDSVYSHRAFAQQYDLKIPLLSDTDGEVAAQYDIGLADDIGQHLVERAVAVVDHDGTVTYSWSTDDLTELPRVEAIKDALTETGGDDTAFARYRVGHAHYTEGRRAFTSAMENFRQTEWVMAQHDFQQAREEFEAAADRFDTALRFVDEDSLAPIYEGANEKATALWQAADWLVQSASAYSSGSGTEGQKLRDDAEIPLSTVREYAEPPDPDGEWPPDIENLEKAETDDHNILPTEPEVSDAALDVDIDTVITDTDEESATDPVPDSAESTADAGTMAAQDSDAADDDIDDDELAEIQAELAASNPDSEPSVEELPDESTSIVDAPPMDEPDGETEPTDEPGSGGRPEVAVDEGQTTGGDEGTDAPAPETPATSTAEAESDGSMSEAAAEADEPKSVEAATSDGDDIAVAATDETDAGEATGSEESDDTDGDDSGPTLQFELAEPDPDPIDADGSRTPSGDESGRESGLDE